jgi:acetyl esterase/lipase
MPCWEHFLNSSADVVRPTNERGMKWLILLPVFSLLGGCSYVSSFVRAQSPRSLFERGYFAEMAVDEGYPAPRVPDGVRRIVDIAYRDTAAARDRRAWLLDVVAPSAASESPRPIVVFAHGGGLNAGAKDDETQVNSNLAIALAQHGYLVLNINHRLASEAPHPAQAQDMAAAVRWAIDHGAALGGDPQRIVLGGFSSGGYLAALLAGDPRYLQEAGAAPARIRAVFAVSGFFDLHHLSQSLPVRKFIVEPAFGARGPAWDAASPFTYADAHWPPTLLLSAARDRSAGPQSDALCTQLQRAKVACRHAVVPASGHATAIAHLGSDRATASFDVLIEFLGRHTAGR